MVSCRASLFDAERAATRAGAELEEYAESIGRGQAQCLQPLFLLVPALYKLL